MGWLFLLKKPDQRAHVARWFLGSGVAAYLIARSWTHAMTPLSAPSYYRPVLNLNVLTNNALQYADWALTFSTVLLGVAWLALGRSRAVVEGPVGRSVGRSVGYHVRHCLADRRIRPDALRTVAF